MIKLTSLLLGGIVITMAYGGRDLPASATAAADRPDTQLAVSRTTLDFGSPALLGIDDERGAIEAALAATDALSRPAMTADPDVRGAIDAAVMSAVGRDAAPDITPVAESPRPVVASEVVPADLRVVNADRVNVRSGPGTANAVVDQVSLGQSLTVLSDADASWTQVRLPNGSEAYIFSRFLDG